MKSLLTALALLILGAVPAYADQHSNEPEDAPNEAETDEAEEDSKGDDFYNYSKD
tara:strand:- start:93 stop:257 length:165 start_codon:yes stop_codon:yes gene_type:complete